MNSEQALRKQIEETLEALDRSTEKAIKSKAAAMKYLVDLGLIEEEKPFVKTTKKVK
jgi:hypothetical protein